MPDYTTAQLIPRIEPERLSRALEYQCARRGDGMDDAGNTMYVPHAWAVWKFGSTLHNVALQPFVTCDCGDFIYRDNVCKHIIRVLIETGDEEVHRMAQRLGLEIGGSHV